ncbi:MAG: isoleucine--tRNA ligase [Myxococcota bacterium]|nr:isoleucine--tRNA ligase [Myxococcota bacterium]
MFRELGDPVELEEEVLSFWRENDVFENGLKLSEGRPSYVFYEGPPTANGTPHNGHVLTRAIKDLFPRYKTMRGYHVPRRAGWDTHGLPVEVEVEKSLGIHGKEAIEAYGLEAFSRKCLDSVFTYTQEWEELTERIGFWVNLDEAYVTYHRSYVESVWWALSELFKKGLLVKGHKIIWWWPQGGTALSAAEVGWGYKEVDDPSITVRFVLADEPNTSLLAWTTTPWTLPSNTAVCVHPELDYAYVRHGDELLIVADALKEQVEGEVEKVVKGSELVGARYTPLYEFAAPEGGDSYVVVGATHVSLDQGTGLVHTAPAFGEDDFQVARDHGLGMLQLVKPDGKFDERAGFVAGMSFKESDSHIIRDLKERGLLFAKKTVRHDYPFCWRADSDPLMQYARPGWFVRTTALNAEALENNQQVNWLPDHIQEGRFGDFLRNNVDWALSRERFWGTPLNIWVCEACEAQTVPGSAAEIERLNPDAFDAEVDRDLQVHRPWIDKVTLPCEACGGTMHRVPEVIDCWFDSGCMPFAQLGYPHQNAEEFQQAFPADFISEAVDQTRGWFYSLLMISTLLFDEETCGRLGIEAPGFPRPYENCVVLGHVCDMDGRKESKSKGNYTPPDLVIRGRMRLKVQPDESVNPGQVGFKPELVRALDLGKKERLYVEQGSERVEFEVVKRTVEGKETTHLHPSDIERLGIEDVVELKAPFSAPGADAFRWLFYASNPPFSNTRLSLRAIREGQREFLLRLRNVHSFFAIYANIAEFHPSKTARRDPSERALLDRWVLHELTALNQRVTERMDDYRLYEAARDLQSFVESLSNWYVRRSRRRFWGEGVETEDALWTLYEVLCGFSRMVAPFVPFIAEALYRDLEVGCLDGAPASVHHCSWPEVDEGLIDASLSEAMALVRELASLGLAARSRVGVRVRQPLAAAEVILAQPEQAGRLGPLLSLLSEELNVREVRFTERAEEFVDFRVKPNFQVLGRRLGKNMKACAAALAARPGTEVRAAVLAGGLEIDLGDSTVLLGEEDVIIEVQPRGEFEAAGSANAVVGVHSAIDEDLREEGLAREIVNRIQGQRKELDLGYTDRIELGISGDPSVMKAVERYREHVATETLVVRWVELGESSDSTEFDVDGHSLYLDIHPA